ncbi:MFS transporter [Sediminicoccus rosea]|uniref:MFS transporter n=1 Tax=Sediminicoccus rosea TaxID=1225128 RepID=A0ABZ0PIB7_9PROT|nr:MFS transporter [Sediminicoccus rosea]WPB85026.1 MFS transporter [Sediminicoccus rosea]
MTPESEADGLPEPRRTRAAACIAAGIALTVLDAAMVNIALPSAARDLGLTPAESVWVVNAYQITVVGTLIPFAALGEIAGFKRVWNAGLALFLLAALCSALAPSFETLLAARIAQGLGGAAVMSLMSGLVRHTYPIAQLGRAIGFNAMVVALCSATGPSLGAAVLAVAEWPAVFLVHLPVGLAALIFGAKVLPDVPRQARAFDLGAAAMNVAAFGLVFLGLDLILHWPVLGLVALALGLFVGGLLIRREMARSVPLLPLDLLRIRTVRFAIGASICMFAAHMVTVISMPFHLSTAGFTPVQIGLIITPYPLAVGLLAPIAGRLADRTASALPVAAGGGVLALALLLLGSIPASLWVCLGLLLAGIGFGCFQAPNNRAILSSAPRHRAGSAGGMQATARVLGQSLGATTAAACFTLAGPWMGFYCGAVLAVMAGVLSLARR